MTYTPPEGVTIGSFTTNTLPASFRAPAGAAISYKIYGTEAGVGTATAEGEPAGYKITLTVNGTPTPIYIGGTKLGAEEYVDFSEQKVYKRTENISKGTEIGSIYGNSSSIPEQYRGKDADSNNRTRTKSSDFYKFSTTQSYTISTPGITGTQVSVYTYDPDDYTSLEDSTWANLPYTFTPSNYAYRFVIRYSDNRTINNANYPNLMITEGSTAPESYDPYLQPTDPPAPLPAITASGENTISSTESLGDVEFTGEWTAIMGSTEDESIDIDFTVDADSFIAFVTVDDSTKQVFDTITMPSSAGSFTLHVVSWGREPYTDTVYNALS